MPFRWNPEEQLALLKYVLKWALITIPIAVVVGSSCAFFLWILDLATAFRFEHPRMLFLLPLAGIFIALLYQTVGKSAQDGNNLILDQIHEPGNGVPSRMAPLILIGTVVTHLFGGSAGREGTAVQMGGSIAGTFQKAFRLNHHDRRTLLMAGVAAGFGAVFGTPLAAALFAIEVLAIGQMQYNAIIPCLISSFLANFVCSAWGIHHTHYHVATFVEMGISLPTLYVQSLLFLKVVLASAVFGLASMLFAELTHDLHRAFHRSIPFAWLRPVLGGLLVVAMVYLLGTRDYIGLGVSSADPNAITILSCFKEGGAQTFSWFWKTLFTSVTLGSGFKGGEVTPLFFIGAALGNTMGQLLHAPVELMAALGFVAVFAAGANTPLACTVMGAELFGSGNILYIATACFIAYIFSGHSGIYLSQRIHSPKIFSRNFPPNSSLRSVREKRSYFWQRFFFRKEKKNEKNT